MEIEDFFEIDLSTNLQRGPSLANQAYRRIKTQFLLGEMQPGKRLTYREIAQDLGVSVTPAREAIFKLLAENVFVPSSSGAIKVPMLSADMCKELWRIRLLLEGPCAAMAAKHIDAATLKLMESSHRAMMDAKQKKKLRDALKFNFLFHFHLYEKSHSPVLVSMIRDLWVRTTSYVEFFHVSHVGKRNEVSTAGPHVHATILSALVERDPARVQAGIERDLVAIKDGILLRLESEDQGTMAKSLPSASAVTINKRRKGSTAAA